MRIGPDLGDRSTTRPLISRLGRLALNDARMTGPLLFAEPGTSWEEIPLHRLAAAAPLRRLDDRTYRRRQDRAGKRAAAMLAVGLVALTFACGSLLGAMSDAARSRPPEVAMPVPAAAPLPPSQAEAAHRPDPVAEAATVAALFSPEPSPTMPIADLDTRAERPPEQPALPHRALGGAYTSLVAFDSAPFPYDGMVPGRGPFLNAGGDGQLGHRTARGKILWQERTFSDSRVLVHIPPGFDPGRPAVLVVFFHGHGATLARDVRDRQQVAAQVSASGANAILVAPQFAVDARDSSAGRFWQAGGFARFLDEAAGRLAQVQGDPALARRLAQMPVLLVAYSGGYLPAAYALKDIAASDRVRGVVLLDALYGELDKYANWLASTPSGFLVSAYTRFTQGRNAELDRTLRQRGVSSGTSLAPDLSRGGASFLATAAGITHTDYVTQAWTGQPIADILRRLPEFSLDRAALTASLGERTRRVERRASFGEP